MPFSLSLAPNLSSQKHVMARDKFLKDHQEWKGRRLVYSGLHAVSKVHSKYTTEPELEAKIAGQQLARSVASLKPALM